MPGVVVPLQICATLVLVVVTLVGATKVRARPNLSDELVFGVVRNGSIRYLDGRSRVRFVIADEVADRPDVVVTFDGELPPTVCDHGHSDVYAVGRRVAGDFEASEVGGVNNHRYDSNWERRCVTANQSPLF
jgi:hypothetical protein